MAFSRNDDRPPRDMVKGNWTCSSCGATITELPFEPRPDSLDRLKCRDCFKGSRSDGRRPAPRRDREMVQGNWTCSGCGTAITELPFEPDASRLDTLLCRDCHRAKRESSSRY